MSIPSRLRAWIELLRVPNLPTVASNAILGAWLGFAAQGRLPSLSFAGWLEPAAGATGTFEFRDLFVVVHLAAGLCALYLVGLVLNDLFDLATDRRERPNRPLPSGRIAPWQAMLAAIVLLVAGVGLLRSVNRAPVLVGLISALVAAIVLYDLLHRRVAVAVVLPAICRGLAVLIAAAATFPATAFEDRWLPIGGLELAVVLVPASVVAIFVLAVSVVARREVEAVSPQGSRVAVRTDLRRGPWWVVTSGLLALVPAVMLGAPSWTPGLADPFGSMQLLRSMVVLALLGVWLFLATRWTPETPVPKLVGRWLGSLCILDAVMLAPLGPLPAALCVGLFAASALLARRFAGS